MLVGIILLAGTNGIRNDAAYASNHSSNTLRADPRVFCVLSGVDVFLPGVITDRVAACYLSYWHYLTLR
jgi:hypothetical protein